MWSPQVHSDVEMFERLNLTKVSMIVIRPQGGGGKGGIRDLSKKPWCFQLLWSQPRGA